MEKSPWVNIRGK